MATPLAVLDLVPVSSGSDDAAALRNAVDLAQHGERFGYQRYWFAEHHLNPGVIGAAPAAAIALVAGATQTIRLGSAGVQIGHRTPLSVVGEFGLIDALHLAQLRDATGADELAITTITHDHADRVRSYELLASEWRRR